MTTNHYFNKFHRRSEQSLVDDLIRESIKIHGHDFVYIPRTLEKKDLIYGEDVLSKFDDYYDIEMYVKTFNGFDGPGDQWTKMQMDIKDSVVLWVSRSQWDRVVGTELQRPREGDLLYYPFNGAIFQVTFVNNESIHYQLGDLYVYEITVEQFVYSDEKFATGIEEVDNIEKASAFTVQLNLGAGTGNYQDDEWVYQGASLATSTAKAQVTTTDVPPGTIKVRNISGIFESTAGPVVGDSSGASHALTSLDTQQDVNDIEDNHNLETEADTVLDFTEDDPFSEGNY